MINNVGRRYMIRPFVIGIASIFCVALSSCKYNGVRQIHQLESEIPRGKARLIFILEDRDQVPKHARLEFAREQDDQCFFWNKIQINNESLDLKNKIIFDVPGGTYTSLSFVKYDDLYFGPISFSVSAGNIFFIGNIRFDKDGLIYLNSTLKPENLKFQTVRTAKSNNYSRKTCTP